METTFSNQDFMFISAAQQEALKSPCLMQHGAVAVRGGKIIGRGYNHYRNQTSDGVVSNSCTCHAEMAAIRDVLRSVNNGCTHYRHSIKVAKD
tara:strand:+ start:442 stop:720 length:279 start_codon:yes stop_codon:yes gene_type:complete